MAKHEEYEKYKEQWTCFPCMIYNHKACDKPCACEEAGHPNSLPCPAPLEYQDAQAIMRNLSALQDKFDGTLDIIQRICAGEDDSLLALDYGGTGWETHPAVKAVYKLREQLDSVVLSREMSQKLALALASPGRVLPRLAEALGRTEPKVNPDELAEALRKLCYMATGASTAQMEAIGDAKELVNKYFGKEVFTVK